MPELPEVETIVRELRPLLTGKTIKRIICLNRKTIECPSALATTPICRIPIAEVFRRGKYICFLLENKTVFTLHLRMTGKIFLQLPRSEKSHVRLRFQMTDNTHLYFVDSRKFGRLQVWPAELPLLPNLGPEPFNTKTVIDVLEKTKTIRSIKTVLLDQSILAGVGNIYADEALFLAGIHPLTPASRLLPGKRKRLCQVLPRLLHQAIRRQGTTIADYRNTRNRPGRQQNHLHVYGREGEPCLTCGCAIHRLRISGRSSYFCQQCQS